MKYIVPFFTFLLVSSYLQAQQFEEYTFNCMSKHGTTSATKIVIKFADKEKIPTAEIAAEKIEKPTLKLLKKYSTVDYYFKSPEIHDHLKKIFTNNFANSEYKIISFYIDIEVDKEVIMLQEKIYDLEQNAMMVHWDINERLKKTKKELETNKKLTKKEKEELEKQLFLLENAQYIQNFYSNRLNFEIKE
ncbi:MAG: hypothetical protein AAF617_12040 [Bacteroidota bacterium]